MVLFNSSAQARQAITPTEVGGEEVTIRAESSPDCGYLGLQAVIFDRGSGPYFLDEKFLADDIATGFGKNQENVEGSSAKVDLDSVAEQ
nr:hypothetical protein [Bradyrhizobium zhanjiangense]